MFKAAKDDDGERHPPNDIVNWYEPENPGRRLIIEDCPCHTDRPEGFGKEADEDNGVVSCGVGGSEGVA